MADDEEITTEPEEEFEEVDEEADIDPAELDEDELDEDVLEADDEFVPLDDDFVAAEDDEDDDGQDGEQPRATGPDREGSPGVTAEVEAQEGAEEVLGRGVGEGGEGPRLARLVEDVDHDRDPDE